MILKVERQQRIEEDLSVKKMVVRTNKEEGRPKTIIRANLIFILKKL